MFMFYSTTRCVTKEKPEIIKRPEDKFETLLFLPPGEGAFIQKVILKSHTKIRL